MHGKSATTTVNFLALPLLQATATTVGTAFFQALTAALHRELAAREVLLLANCGTTQHQARILAGIPLPEHPETAFPQDGSNDQWLFPIGCDQTDTKGCLLIRPNTPAPAPNELAEIIGLLTPRIAAEIERENIRQTLLYSHQRETMHSRILGMATRHHPLTDVLNAIVRGVEQEHPHLICSVLLADSEGKRLRIGAAPSLPDEYNKAIDRTRIGHGIGSCGTAAHTGERLIATNLQEHPYWKGVRELTAKHQLASCWSQPIKDNDGKVLGTFAIYQKQAVEPSPMEIELIEATAQLLGLVLQHYRALDQLHVRTSKYQMFLQVASDGIVVMDETGRIQEVSAGFLRMVCATREEVLASSIWDWDALNDEEACKRRLASVNEEPILFRTINRTKTGSLWNAEVSAAAMNINGQRLIWASARDITERKRLESELQRRATTDELTGVPNRGHFMETLKSEFSRARRHDRSLAVIMMDLDHFKSINDLHGHATGDDVLRAVTRACSKALREEDFLGRLGGEEFAIMLPETEALNAMEAAERFRKLITNIAVDAADSNNGPQVIRPTCSLGVAIAVPTDSNHEQLLARADKALYEAKASGRNRACFAK